MNKLLLAACFALVSVGAANAQLKLGIMNTQKALLETADIKKAQMDLEAKFKPRQDQMIKLQRELEDIQAQLNSGKLNELGTQELNAEGQRKQRELQRLQQDLQEDVERERTEILQRAGMRMQEVVKKLAEEKALDVVVDSANTLYFKAPLDITAEATAAYDKAYPVASAAKK
ncbi:MAG: OmpH family outer membrane protein [Bryobacterales bacterium]|nr:OmpH family outer membrane protein [Bryobacterales bacterium]